MTQISDEMRQKIKEEAKHYAQGWGTDNSEQDFKAGAMWYASLASQGWVSESEKAIKFALNIKELWNADSRKSMPQETKDALRLMERYFNEVIEKQEQFKAGIGLAIHQ